MDHLQLDIEMDNYTFGNVDFPPSIGEGILELF